METYSHWNYRIVFHESLLGPWCSILEVYYAEDGTPVGWVDDSSPSGESVEEVLADLALMAKAADAPPLYLRDERLHEQ